MAARLMAGINSSGMLVAFHKPYGVLSRFTSDGSGYRPLSEFGLPPRIYPLGRLDADSEGLLLLTDERRWNHELLNPRAQHPRLYWVQVERIPDPESLRRLSLGIKIRDWLAAPCQARILDPAPELPDRIPPIRFRKTVPTCWLSMELTEGKNRQVRRMTAAVGHPTLRLVRVRIGCFDLGNLPPGQWRILSQHDRALVRQTQGPPPASGQ
ncbi:MAG TPA: pseudouridine synthase [Candidatus Paceibacterota bacterium]|nr:pseudouridine synthase [Verrucomicrobiota bacterium]HRY48711.1 pseudouridine synthase [Candidatus Paceibacterota bacterium]